MSVKDKQRNEIARLETLLKVTRKWLKEEKAKTKELREMADGAYCQLVKSIGVIANFQMKLEELRDECNPDRTVSTQWLEMQCNEMLRVGRKEMLQCAAERLEL